MTILEKLVMFQGEFHFCPRLRFRLLRHFLVLFIGGKTFIGPKSNHGLALSVSHWFRALVVQIGFVKVVSWICQNWYIGISLICYMDLSKFIHGFLLVVTWIFQSSYMDLSKLFRGFVVVVVLCISLPFPNKTKLKFDQDFKLVEASASNWRCLINQSTQCLGSDVPLAMFKMTMTMP